MILIGEHNLMAAKKTDKPGVLLEDLYSQEA